MKNNADQGRCYPQRLKAEMDNTLRDLQNSSYPTKAELNYCFIIHSKYFPVFKGVSSFRSLFFRSPKITQPRPQVFSVNGSIICSGLHFWRHRLNNLQRAALVTSLVQYFANSSWLWWIMRVALTNQKRINNLNEWKYLTRSLHSLVKYVFNMRREISYL